MVGGSADAMIGISHEGHRGGPQYDNSRDDRGHRFCRQPYVGTVAE